MEKISSIRRGKTINVKWTVTADITLDKDKLTLELIDPVGKVVAIPAGQWSFYDNVVEYTHEGTTQRHIGKYGYTLWHNKGEKTQTVVDKTCAYILVSHTECECPQHRDNLELTTVDLGSSEFNAYPVIGGGGGCDCELISKEETADLFDVSNIQTSDGYELISNDGKLLLADDISIVPEPEPEHAKYKWIIITGSDNGFGEVLRPFIIQDGVVHPVYTTQVVSGQVVYKNINVYSITYQQFVAMPQFDYEYDVLTNLMQTYAIPYTLCQKEECIELTEEMKQSFLSSAYEGTCPVYINWKGMGEARLVSIRWGDLSIDTNVCRVPCIKINTILYPLYRTNIHLDNYMEHADGTESGWVGEGNPIGEFSGAGVGTYAMLNLLLESEGYNIPYLLCSKVERIMITPELRARFVQELDTCEEFSNYDN